MFSKFDYAKAHVHFSGDSYGAQPPECIASRDRHIKDLHVKVGILRQSVESADNRCEELQLMLSDERAKVLDATTALDAFAEEVFAMRGDVDQRWVSDRIQRVWDILRVRVVVEGEGYPCPRCGGVTERERTMCPKCANPLDEASIMRRYIRRFGQEAWDANWEPRTRPYRSTE